MVKGFSTLLGAFLCVVLLTPSFVAAATFERPLFLGSVGPDVSALQQILMDRGVYRYPSITGFFGQVTFQAVADFQRSVGLDPLGYVGPATRALLNSGTLPVPLPAVLALGSVGPDVSALQILLRDAGFFTYPNITTYFGPVTQAALMAYQQATGVPVTGTYTAGSNITRPETTPQTSSSSGSRSGGRRSNGNDNDDDQVADTTGPVLSSISATPSQTSATIEWITDEAADTQLAYGITASYGATTTLDAALETSHTVSLSGLTAATTYHYRIYARDASGNLTASSDQTFTTTAAPDTTGPTFSNISADPTDTTVSITWDTNEAATSRLEYGTTVSYGTFSALDATLETDHTISLSGLTHSTQYYYRVISTDAAGNTSTSTGQTFTTDSWVAQDVNGNLAYLDARFDDSLYSFAGQQYNQAGFLSASGGVASSTGFIFGPVTVGSEILDNPNFDTNVNSWAPTSGSVSLSWQSTGGGRLRNTYSTSGQTRFQITATSTAIGRAYRFAGSLLGTTNSGSVTLSSRPAGGGVSSSAFTLSGFPRTQEMYFGGSQTPVAPGTISNTGGAGYDEWDNFSLTEVRPYTAWSTTGMSALVRLTTASATTSADQVAFQADTNERDRVRLVWSSDQHLRFIVTFNNVEQTNIDLGIVATSTAASVRFSLSNNDLQVSLNDGAAQTDATVTVPGMAYLRIGRSSVGELWAGTLSEVAVWNAVQDIGVQNRIAVYGDSTAAGSGGSPDWYANLLEGYNPDRTGYRNATGGQDSGTMLTGILADTAHRSWITIIMDRPNTGEGVSTWISNIKSAVAHLTTSRWLIIPPAQNVPDTAVANITGVQQELLSDSFFSGHTFDSGTQASYLSDLSTSTTRADGLHFNAAGQAIQANYIRAFLDAQGW